MRRATLVTGLTGATLAMAVAAPLAVFGFLYVLQVQPERSGAVDARNQLDAARADLHRLRLSARAPSITPDAASVDEFVARAGNGERVGDLVDALTALLNSSAVGGVSNLLFETGAPGIVRTPVTMMFDARHEQVVRLFRSLNALPRSVDVQSVEIAPGPQPPPGLTRARVLLLVSHPPVEAVAKPRRARDPIEAPPAASMPQPVPVVSSILISNGRRVARVDGRIVRPGDRLQAGVVHAIEPDAVVLRGPDGRLWRAEIERSAVGTRTR
jgi:hypothetical protein